MIDMHLHTTWSDGSLSTGELTDKLKDNDITHAVLTDHDCILGYNSFLKHCEEKGIITIPGVELEAYYDIENSKYLHLLCYDYDDGDKLNKFLENERQLRIKAILEGIEKLKEKGINIEFENVKKMSEGRHLLINHLCILLEKMNVVKSRFDAYNMFLDENSDYYVEYPKYSVENMIKLGHEVGGSMVLAHPRRINMDYEQKEKYIKYLKEIGLDGIEAYYADDTKEQRDFSIRMGEKYSLIQTVGSDWHCIEDNIDFGNSYVDEKHIKVLKRRFFNE